jgi:hypothetical protein
MAPLLVQSIVKKCFLTIALDGFSYLAILHEFTFFSAIMAPSLLVFLHSEINLCSEFQDVLHFVSEADAAAIVETH